ncbi:hypothetical protein [Gorillibacterium massiliense]|uniref:hypothetical protein n=1 Tax=Gorillibacterium massiliense TaxID=1280390 RepID=UPI0004AFC8E6|nr:hypothetical protein [Gorillibacterium massiliense]
MSKTDVYVEEVIRLLHADPVTLSRIRSDLYASIAERTAGGESEERVLAGMGSPAEMAEEFMAGLYSGMGEMRGGHSERDEEAERSRYYEFRSRTTVKGIPLVHIKHRRNRGFVRPGKPAVAKGIVAIGDIAIGYVAIGGVAIGGVTAGGITAGLLSLGGIVVGLAAACGGVAVGAVAVGGIACGIFAIGGLAVGMGAIGGYAVGHVAIGDKAVGEIAHSTAEKGSLNWAESKELFRQGFPRLVNWLDKWLI